jgi:hypothetical protein
MTKFRSREEVEAALNELSTKYDYYCGVTSRAAIDLADKLDGEIAEKLGWKGEGVARAAYRWQDARVTAEFRSKIKALYWVLGEKEL